MKLAGGPGGGNERPLATGGVFVGATMYRIDATTSEATQTVYPAWISHDLIADTLATWQPYYSEELTEREAVAILQSVGRLIDVLEHSP